MDTKIQPVIPPAKRGPYRQHSTEFKRAVVARSLVAGTSVSRLAREFNINANQVFTWRKQFADMREGGAEKAGQLLPVTVLESAGADVECASPSSGVILLTVGPVQLRLEGGVDATTLAQVLTRLLP
ncbi:hypothetical protein CR152_21680 [Massilia violaceinigra]|uniref:Transposase n=1 Tax=Massilia violaceinigra TaxID=2045208 RepID=A0A2D2DPE8_9BURK|nr:transposase [Massilia violaceinigra]ATQ76840.1 hypothetical protein CR152_21680 [Massilia violaceinigra]